VPYFIFALGMVVFSRLYKYESIISELIINTILIAAFVVYAQYRDKLITLLFRRD